MNEDIYTQDIVLDYDDEEEKEDIYKDIDFESVYNDLHKKKFVEFNDIIDSDEYYEYLRICIINKSLEEDVTDIITTEEIKIEDTSVKMPSIVSNFSWKINEKVEKTNLVDLQKEDAQEKTWNTVKKKTKHGNNTKEHRGDQKLVKKKKISFDECTKKKSSVLF